ncbi:unnamed protein product, partial [Aphanomyces euteiches]
DPETPLESAQAVAAALGDENAVLVTREGFGHGTMGHASQCIHAIVVDFFQSGQLPANTTCRVDGNPFVPPPTYSAATKAMQTLAEIQSIKSRAVQVMEKAKLQHRQVVKSWRQWFFHALGFI